MNLDLSWLLKGIHERSNIWTAYRVEKTSLSYTGILSNLQYDWLQAGVIAQLVEHWTRVAELMVHFPFKPEFSFRRNFHSRLACVYYWDDYWSLYRIPCDLKVFFFLKGNFKPRCDQAADRKKMEQICFVLVQVFFDFLSMSLSWKRQS